MFKDTDSAQFLLVKLGQSVMESKRILFCGCHVLLRESALPWLVTTCWRGWEWFREGSWITEILFIYSESPSFFSFFFASSSQLAVAAFVTLWHILWIVWNVVWLKGGTAERTNVWKKVEKMENRQRCQSRGQSGPLEVPLKVLNPHSLVLRSQVWKKGKTSRKGQGLRLWKSIHVWCVTQVRFSSVIYVSTPVNEHRDIKVSTLEDFTTRPGLLDSVSHSFGGNLSRHLNMWLCSAATCVWIDMEALLPRRGQGSSIKQAACSDPCIRDFTLLAREILLCLV